MTKPTQSRELILDILMEILEKGGYSHVVLRQALEKYQYLEKQDRALITRITEGTIEYRMTIDQILNRCSKVPVEKMKPVIRTILRMSVYQIFWMDRIPEPGGMQRSRKSCCAPPVFRIEGLCKRCVKNHYPGKGQL